MPLTSLRRCAVPVVFLLLASLSDVGLAAQGSRAARLRDAASDLLGGAVDTVAGLGRGEDLDDAILQPASGGAYEQTLGDAVFAVPVAGNIGYVLRAEIYHDLSIVFPPDWQLVQVFVGDPTRWRVTHASSLVVVQPGEAGARTNLTAVFASGELLQIDLEELTGTFDPVRTGRAYVGTEGWLLDRIFALMPEIVQELMLARLASGSVGVAALLADPVEVIRGQGAFEALPPRIASSSVFSVNPVDVPADPGLAAASSPLVLDPPAVDVAPAVPLLVPEADPAPPPGPLRDRFFPAPRDLESQVPRTPLVPAPFSTAPIADFGSLPGFARVIPVSLALPGQFPASFPELDRDDPARLASASDLAGLESQLASASGSRDYARRSAGDRIARATLGIDQRLEDLATDYPGRVQFSLLLDPDIPPFTPPFWHLGQWHDGDYTYWRTLADAPVFVDTATGRSLPAVKLDDYLYRLDGVVQEGTLIVAGPHERPRHLFWRRREELEGP